MNGFRTKCAYGEQLRCLAKAGLLRELYRRHHITQSQFELLMELQRS